LIRQPPKDRPLSVLATLPGITVNNEYLTAWLTTVFGNGYGIGYSGQQANITTPELTLTNSDSNLHDVAHVYFAYQDPYLMKGPDNMSNVSNVSIDSWRALKGTLRLCLQTLNTTRNTSTETTVLESFTNLT
jgi:hypothetical protein